VPEERYDIEKDKVTGTGQGKKGLTGSFVNALAIGSYRSIFSYCNVYLYNLHTIKFTF
jgi:hypothetical protein